MNHVAGRSEHHLPATIICAAIRPISSQDLPAVPFPPIATPSWGWIMSMYRIPVGVSVVTQVSLIMDTGWKSAEVKAFNTNLESGISSFFN